MRIPSSVFAAGRKILGLLLVAGSIAMVSGQRSSNFSPRDRAAYAPQAAVQYVNPGLFFSVVSAKIATDGTITGITRFLTPGPRDSRWIRLECSPRVR